MHRLISGQPSWILLILDLFQLKRLHSQLQAADLFTATWSRWKENRRHALVYLCPAHSPVWCVGEQTYSWKQIKSRGGVWDLKIYVRPLALPLAIPGLVWLTNLYLQHAMPSLQSPSNPPIHPLWTASLWYKEQSFNQLQGRSCENSYCFAPFLLPEGGEGQRPTFLPLFQKTGGLHTIAIASPKQVLPVEAIS